MNEKTRAAWVAIAVEFGLFNAAEVFNLLGLSGLEGTRNNLIAVQFNGVTFYPGFQFDAEKNQVRPGIARIVSEADVFAISHESLTLWMTSPTGQIAGSPRPVDVLASDPDTVATAFQNHFGVEW